MLDALLRPFRGLLDREDDRLIHVPGGKRPEAARKLADALEKIMRDGSPDAPADTALCTGCVLITVADATRLLLSRYAPQLPKLKDEDLLDFLHQIAQGTDRPS